MDRRLLAIVAALAAFTMIFGFADVDRLLAETVHASGIENARVFREGLHLLDSISRLGLPILAIPIAVFAIGAIGFALRRRARWPRALILAAGVQFVTILTMIAMKDRFGRLRPFQVFASGQWDHVWFAGGESFPSGHSAFYFGLLLPLAAATPLRWPRAALLGVAGFVIAARVDMAMHFLSDVATSALLASVYALIVGSLARDWLPPSRRTQAAQSVPASSP